MVDKINPKNPYRKIFPISPSPFAVIGLTMLL
jgi:hypothetical protein